MFNEITWREGEKQAKEYMEKCGYKIIYTNFFCAGVELDIVSILPKEIQEKKLKKETKQKIKNAPDKKTKLVLKQIYENLKTTLEDMLVITEVKARSSDRYGTGSEAVDDFKVANIKRGADFLLSKKEYEGMQVRFDIASVDSGKLSYIENAF